MVEVLTEGEVEHFRLFGFVVLRDLLDPDTTTRLRLEVERSLRGAYGERFDERGDSGGIAGRYLPMMAASTPMMAASTPVSQPLVVNDGRLMGAAASLLGRAVLPDHAEGILYFKHAARHFDDGIGVDGVKFSVYLDRLDADNGALRLLPGSHDRTLHPALRAYERGHIRAEGELDMPRHRAHPGIRRRNQARGRDRLSHRHVALQLRREGPARLDDRVPPRPRGREGRARGSCNGCATATTRRVATMTGAGSRCTATGLPTPTGTRSAPKS